MVTFSKREILGAPLLAALGVSMASRASGQASDVSPYRLDRAPDRFEPTVQSLKEYQTPEWFRDAKFGIWAHWGPQAVPRKGDWYARFMSAATTLFTAWATPTSSTAATAPTSFTAVRVRIC